MTLEGGARQLQSICSALSLDHQVVELCESEENCVLINDGHRRNGDPSIAPTVGTHLQSAGGRQ